MIHLSYQITCPTISRHPHLLYHGWLLWSSLLMYLEHSNFAFRSHQPLPNSSLAIILTSVSPLLNVRIINIILNVHFIIMEIMISLIITLKKIVINIFTIKYIFIIGIIDSIFIFSISINHLETNNFIILTKGLCHYPIKNTIMLILIMKNITKQSLSNPSSLHHYLKRQPFVMTKIKHILLVNHIIVTNIQVVLSPHTSM